MIIKQHRLAIEERYRAYLVGARGLLGVAMHSNTPLTLSTKKGLRAALLEMSSRAKTDVAELVEAAVIEATSISYDIALEEQYAIDESMMQWDALTDAMSDSQSALIESINAKIDNDVYEIIKAFNRFRLKVGARLLADEAAEQHLIVSEREKTMQSFSFKFTDRAGKKFPSEFYVGKLVNHELRTLQRDAMFYLLVSMGETKGRIFYPNHATDGKTVDLHKYMNDKGSVFHYGSHALLVKSLVT